MSFEAVQLYLLGGNPFGCWSCECVDGSLIKGRSLMLNISLFSKVRHSIDLSDNILPDISGGSLTEESVDSCTCDARACAAKYNVIMLV